MRELDRMDIAKADKAEYEGDVDGEGGVKVVEGVTVAVVGIRHPAHREVTIENGRFQLMQSL